MDEWLKDVKPEDFSTENMKLIAEQCGVDTAILLLQKMAGLSVYVPTGGIKALMANHIKKKYNKDRSRDNANRIALECGVSVNHIYNIVNNNNIEETSGRRQISLFENQ